MFALEAHHMTNQIDHGVALGPIGPTRVMMHDELQTWER
jgi:hypothetical protein